MTCFVQQCSELALIDSELCCAAALFQVADALPPALASPPQRRLILGAVAAVGLGAFALVPTQQLAVSKPSKPLFFYLVPLLRWVGGRRSSWGAPWLCQGP